MRSADATVQTSSEFLSPANTEFEICPGLRLRLLEHRRIRIDTDHPAGR